MEQQKINWGLFKPLEEKLKGAPTAITAVNHNHLLLEEIMLLKVLGDNVLLLNSSPNIQKEVGNARFQKTCCQSPPNWILCDHKRSAKNKYISLAAIWPLLQIVRNQFLFVLTIRCR